MKKIITGILTCCLALALAVPGFAGPQNRSAVFVLNKASYIMDNQTKTMDASTFMENNRVYVPVRYLALSLGVPENGVLWDAASRTATLTMDGTTVKLVIGSTTYYINGQAKQMDVSPLVRNGRTYLPARFVAEAFGYTVNWDAAAQAVLVYPPGQKPPVPPAPPVPPVINGKIDMNAARNGTLQPPPGAVAPPDVWGFPAKAVRMEFKVGSRYVKVTRTDGSKYQLDLGTPCVVVGNPIGVESLKKQYPAIYNNANSIPLPGAEYGALYVPFIPVAEAFGVPRENIVWDGQHLAVFGYYGNVNNYRVHMTPVQREAVCKVVGTNPEVGSGKSEFPLIVKNGVVMVGTNSVSDITSMLFPINGGHTPGLVNVKVRAGWDYETGTVIAD